MTILKNNEVPQWMTPVTSIDAIPEVSTRTMLGKPKWRMQASFSRQSE
jgi:hypothetical protein